MSILATCPACQNLVNLPDTAAGTRVACPKCRAEVPVPADDDADEVVAAEVVEEPGAKPRKGGKKKGKGKGKKAAGGPPPRLIAAAVGGLVAMLLVVGVGAWALSRWATAEPPGDPWAKLDGPDGVFTAHFPRGLPKYDSMWSEPPDLKLPGNQTLKDILPKMEGWVERTGGREYTVLLLTIPPGGGQGGASGGAVDGAMAPPVLFNAQVLASNEIEVNGHRGQFVAVRNPTRTVVQQTFRLGDKYALKVGVVGNGEMKPDDPTVAEFLRRSGPNP